ncbi:bifunctional oligoribonuclease/PAP phosphatase NrnA [Persephonella atlantica]|uniref:Bifunctional oligoribonuclease/PAP phosphatase NrnA n=1 Tax=Persephonella atlantica TaxID=2699429 RepID=A0ABS1GG78_9AQUI|nr:bifunctional oligoribonuclease/PAP phosphatase NrnA [Persephonella atlantica]MBK3331924.1 bifunctional oligoribonuclease/PAP phosphatase NrnA [Persephonella atlantica]
METVIPAVERLKREEGEILLVTHHNPDGDGIGSMIALYRFLKKKGKNVRMAMKDDVPHVYDFLPDIEKIEKLPVNHIFSLAVILDAAGMYRADAPVNAKEYMRIDHHIGGIFESINDYVDPYAASTTVVVGRLLKHWDESCIDKEIATCLYTGLLTDTGSFRHNNVNEEAFEFARYLISKGIDPSKIASLIFERNKPSVIHLLNRVLSTLEMHADGKIASLIVKRDFIEETGSLEEDTEGFVNFARSIEGVEVAFIMIQKEDRETWRVSLRGKGRVNVQKIAKRLGGGGHRDAAGCRLKGSLEEVKNKIISEIQREMYQEQVLV